MQFKIWLEAKFNINPSKIKGELALKIDNRGNIVELTDEDYKNTSMTSHFGILPKAKAIKLYRISPQSPDFRRLVNALKPKFNDIGNWDVEVFIAAGHMTTGSDKHYRNVDYWMKQPTAELENKLPKYFYHGTSTNLWYEGIKTKGLMPRKMSGSTGSYGAQNITSLSKSNLVYLSLHPDAAAREAAKQSAEKHGGKALIIRINSDGLFKDKLFPDEDARQAKTAQDSARLMGTVGYAGKIPPSSIEPFLIGDRYIKGNRYYDKWEKFRDVEIEEHPITKKIKQGFGVYSGDPAYYALKDAGIIKQIDSFTDSGHRQTSTEIKKDVTDDEVRKILKSSGWTRNVQYILHDLELGYRGTLYRLKDMTVPTNLTKQQEEVINILLNSKIITKRTWNNREYFLVDNYNMEPKAITAAKLMGKMQFDEIAEVIKELTKDQSS